MDRLIPLAERVAARLRAENATVVVAESSTGGLVSAALLSLPGASAYFLGGAVIYTKTARASLLGIPAEAMVGIRSATETYATLLATTARERFGAVWALGETGAAGPSGNGYGDPPGHCCIAVVGPRNAVATIETGSADRAENMRAFGQSLLELFLRQL
ncbi:MAG: CinA family protein [Acetobacteraceae bacterium]|nr:CinA family protein [Acetobacteraceae bacterium]